MALFARPKRSNTHAPGPKREDAASPMRQQCCREMVTPHGLRRSAALGIAALASPMRSGCFRATGEPRHAASAALMCVSAEWHLAVYLRLPRAPKRLPAAYEVRATLLKTGTRRGFRARNRRPNRRRLNSLSSQSRLLGGTPRARRRSVKNSCHLAPRRPSSFRPYHFKSVDCVGQEPSRTRKSDAPPTAHQSRTRPARGGFLEDSHQTRFSNSKSATRRRRSQLILLLVKCMR